GLAFECAGIVGVAWGEVGEDEGVYACVAGEAGGFAGGGMAGFAGAVGFVATEGGLVDEQVCGESGVGGGAAGAGVTGVENLAAGPGRADDVCRFDSSAVNGDGMAAMELTPEGSFGNSQLAGPFRIEA